MLRAGADRTASAPHPCRSAENKMKSRWHGTTPDRKLSEIFVHKRKNLLSLLKFCLRGPRIILHRRSHYLLKRILKNLEFTYVGSPEEADDVLIVHSAKEAVQRPETIGPKNL